MPQAPRKDPAVQRTQDKELKRARGAMSCAECRRLKLKCDKVVPCSSCKRRGCSAICPNGSLITGQGTRFVLADTEKLHDKIGDMSDRIRQLEDGLAVLQSALSPDPHPLLSHDLLKVKSSIELHSAIAPQESEQQTSDAADAEDWYIDAFGTLAIRDDGAATFYGRSAGSESLLIGEAREPSPKVEAQPHSLDWGPALPAPIVALSNAFPFSVTVHPELDTPAKIAAAFLPPWLEAWRLLLLYLETAPWFFGPVTRKQITNELFPPWYEDAREPAPTMPPPEGVEPEPSFPQGGAHELALLFAVFCFGALTDVDLPAPPGNADAEQYYQLARACLALEPVLDRPSSVATVQVLSMMAIYQGLCSGDNSIESTWALMGLATKLAQSVGLHRDCARWRLPGEEVQKRRVLFWELFITDCWQSLATGRLPSFPLPFVDCELPIDEGITVGDDENELVESFSHWKARFGSFCVAPVVQGTLMSRAPKYSIILELDRRLREMVLPKYAQGAPPEGVGLAETMRHFMPSNYRNLTLLYIHRCFFAHAIASNPQDPIKSQYAPSFLAGYRTACALVNGLKAQFAFFPEQIARFWVLWTHAFSSSVMLASVVTHCSQSKVAPAALLELKGAVELFAQAAVHGGRARSFLPILQRLLDKAQRTYFAVSSGAPPPPPSSGRYLDELAVFSGETNLVATKRVPVAAPSGSGPDSASLPPSLEPPRFAGAHPMLVDDLETFDGKIDAQVRDAYYVGHDAFAGELLEARRQHQQQQQQQQQVQMQQQQQQQIQEQAVQAQAGQLQVQKPAANALMVHEQANQTQVQQQYRHQQPHHQLQHHQQYHQQAAQAQQTQKYPQQQGYEDQRQQQAQHIHNQQQQQQPYQPRQSHEQEQRLYPLHQTQQQDILQQQHQHQSRSQRAHRPSQLDIRHSRSHPQRPEPYPQSHYSYLPSPSDSVASGVPVSAPAAPVHALAHSRSHSNLNGSHIPQPGSQHIYPAQYSRPSTQQRQLHQANYGVLPSPADAPPSYSLHDPPDARCAAPELQYPSPENSQYATSPEAGSPYHAQQAYGAQPMWNGAQYVGADVQVPASDAYAQQQSLGFQQYIPGATLRGIAADDQELQDTWTSFMYQVASPRQYMAD